MDDKIIEFDELSLKFKKPKELFTKTCYHKYVLINRDTRMLECRKCHRIVEPYDFLYNWAIYDWNLDFQRERLQKKIEILSKQLDELKRQERNIKSRIKRAEKK